MYQLLTLEQLRQRERQLSADVLQLLQTFEQETQTHSTPTIDIDTVEYTGDGVTFKKIVGLKIYVKLE